MTERSEETPLPSFTQRVTVGSELSVSPYCIGISTPDVVVAAFERGINFFFVSADLHWPKYAGTREGLARLCARGARDQFVVCATSYMWHPEFSVGAFTELLAEVPGLGHLDIVCAGGAYVRELPDRLPRYRQLREARDFGCRAIATSFHERVAARSAVLNNDVDLALIRLNPTHPNGRHDVLDVVDSGTQTKVYAFKTTSGFRSHAQLLELGIGADNWAPARVDLYRYALSAKGLSGVLMAPRLIQHLDVLEQAIDHGPLSPDEVSYLDTLFGHVNR